MSFNMTWNASRNSLKPHFFPNAASLHVMARLCCDFWFDIGATRELNFWSGCFIKNNYPYLSIKSSFLQLHIFEISSFVLYIMFSRRPCLLISCHACHKEVLATNPQIWLLPKKLQLVPWSSALMTWSCNMTS